MLNNAGLIHNNVSPNTVVSTAPIVIMIKSRRIIRSEEHTSELQSPKQISYAVFCLKKKKNISNVVTDAASGVVDIFHGIDKAVADTWNNFWKDGKADGIGSNLSRK